MRVREGAQEKEEGEARGGEVARRGRRHKDPMTRRFWFTLAWDKLTVYKGEMSATRKREQKVKPMHRTPMLAARPNNRYYDPDWVV